MRPYRSILFVPGHKPEWVEKAIAARADAIVLDLEDAVPGPLKQGTRRVVAESIERLRAEPPAKPVGVFVRCNSLVSGEAGSDLEAVVAAGPDGIFAPKVESPSDVVRFDALLDHFDAGAGHERPTELFVPIETIAAIQSCEAIAAASPRVGAMTGPTAENADITRAVGFEWTPGGEETLHLRSRVLLACRAAGVHPVTALWERVRDLDGLREFSRAGRRLGFRGQIVIHPSHAAVVNEVYTPTSAQIEFYRGLVEAYDRSAAEGRGASVYRDAHIDEAHAERAREWLREADAVLALEAGAA
ncbi:MAG: HpcH/HpaI aldolase/citrate lyase family protein [Solirubrobacterales bacterium]